MLAHFVIKAAGEIFGFVHVTFKKVQNHDLDNRKQTRGKLELELDFSPLADLSFTNFVKM